MASSYLTYQVGRPGYSESFIAGNFCFSSISRVHLRDPVEHPGCANHSTGSTLLKPIRALAGINGIVAGRSLSNQFTGQTGCPLLQKEHSILLRSSTEPSELARLQAVSFQHAGDWLNCLPITSCGLRLSDDAIRVAVGLRLGANSCQPHTCASGALVTARGTHGLSCALAFGRSARHASINDIIHHSLNKAGFPAIKEPQGMLRSDGRRPDSTTLIPWRAGRNLVWDATVIDTIAPSYLQATAATAGAAAEIADVRKTKKYEDLLKTHHFIPLALENLGPINET